MWHFTAREAVTGNIGKHSDADIAEAVCWPSEKGSEFLIQMLLNTHWLDAHPIHRLVVHDWHDHCDQTVTKYVQRNNLKFASLEISTSFPQGDSYLDRQMADLSSTHKSYGIQNGVLSGQRVKMSGQNGRLDSPPEPEPEPEPEPLRAAVFSGVGEAPPQKRTRTPCGSGTLPQPIAHTGLESCGSALPAALPIVAGDLPAANNVQVVRNMLIDWLYPCRFRKPPDDALCERLIEIAHGPDQIARWLRGMGAAKDKKAIQSWGWFITVATAELAPQPNQAYPQAMSEDAAGE